MPIRRFGFVSSATQTAESVRIQQKTVHSALEEVFILIKLIITARKTVLEGFLTTELPDFARPVQNSMVQSILAILVMATYLQAV